jgi:hypothetical protein
MSTLILVLSCTIFTGSGYIGAFFHEEIRKHVAFS